MFCSSSIHLDSLNVNAVVILDIINGPARDIKLIIDVDKLVDIHLNVTQGGELLANIECK